MATVTPTTPAAIPTTGGNNDVAIGAMNQAVKDNGELTAATIKFQSEMQGINSTREAATEAYKQAGNANQAMHQ